MEYLQVERIFLRPKPSLRPAVWTALSLLAIVAAGCHGPAASSPAKDGAQTGEASVAEALSGPEGLKLLSLFNRGAALMEQYEYKNASAVFQQVVEEIPNWTAARFNLGLAYLNMAGQMDSRKSLEAAIQMFNGVLEQQPDNLHALFSLGMAHDYLGELDKALAFFKKVHALDPDDLFAAHKYGEDLRRTGHNEEAIAVLEGVVRRDPGFVSSVYLLASLYMVTKQRDKAMPLFERFEALHGTELNSGSFVVNTLYGMAGKYYEVLGPDGVALRSSSAKKTPRIVFSPQVKQLDTKCVSWKWKHGTIRLPAVAVVDVDADGDLDLLLSARNEQGEATLWINDGTGSFSKGDAIATDVVAPSIGDVDNDGDTDFWLGCAGANQLMLNDGKGKFTPGKMEGIEGPDVLTPVSRLFDIDSDGDLDLLAFHWTRGDIPGQGDTHGTPASVFLNNRDGTVTDRAKTLGLAVPNTAIASVVCDDVDRDRDLDLVLFPCKGAPIVWINHRLGEYKLLESSETGLNLEGAYSAIAGDPDKDDDRDLLVFTSGGIQLFLNRGQCRFETDAAFRDGVGQIDCTGGQFVDMDNDGDLDILVADARQADGSYSPTILVNQWPDRRFIELSKLDAGNLLQTLHTKQRASCVAADFTGNGRCDILMASAGDAPMLIENVTAGGHWIALDLVGKRPRNKMSRSANSAIGARVEIKTGAVVQQYVVGGNSGPVSAAPLRIHAGLGENPKIDWLRIIWPDSVLQGEVEVPGGRVATIAELNRKISSCPMLFAWDGDQFSFVSDFGGVGGLGYLVAPGVHARPDPTEYLRIPKLDPIDGQYVLQTLTQLEEIAYLDQLKLVAIDHPEGTTVYPNEMMAINAPLPEFQVYCVRKPIDPIRAIDQNGQDVTRRVMTVDRRYAGATKLDPRFAGVAEPHQVVLDFGDRLTKLAPKDRLVLILAGWVEYGYSSTNYAASQANVELKAPTIEVERDGRWHAMFPEVGYPAGINHVMTLEVTGKLRPTDRKIRISSNMEVYWDRIFLARHEVNAKLFVKEVAPSSAELHFRGYPREYSPDGRQPNLYDYANLDPSVGWKLMSGDFTRFGDVGPLLSEVDDCFVIMGHGEEITLRFRVSDFGPVPRGYRRTFLLKADSYCKDMDLYTAFPDTVEPLPFHAMSGYPYGAGEHYPETDKTRAYRAKYNTRRIQAR